MDNNQISKTYRDVRTVLFCKSIPNISNIPDVDADSSIYHDTVYKEICDSLPEIKTDSDSSLLYKQTFLTFGDFEAVSVYQTSPDFGAPDWLYKVYEDKQQIIRKPSTKMVHHQMHLVSQNRDTEKIWSLSNSDYPFFLVSLVYGVNTKDLADNTSSKTDSRSDTDSDSIECSNYEKAVQRCLNQYLKEHFSTVKYAVYNGITVSDVVVLWRASDLRDVMDAISYLEYSGTARKTLTTLGFPVDENDGKVMPCVFSSLARQVHRPITLSIRGSIRDITRFLKVKEHLTARRTGYRMGAIEKAVDGLLNSDLTDDHNQQNIFDLLACSIPSEEQRKALEDLVRHNPLSSDTRAALSEARNVILNTLSFAIPQHNCSLSLGKNDFTFSAQISCANLAHLLDVYREYHLDICHACWEILTDIRKDHPMEKQEWHHAAHGPSDILSKIYNDFLNLYLKDPDQSTDSTTQIDLTQYSWFDSMLELLGTHYYIDRHPVLHGPSYLIYKSLKIARAYFSGSVTDFDTPEKLKRLLARSEGSIIRFIRNWDQLTEQISRNDDAMLNNRCTTHTIHFSLPESALDFYHAFLRRIVDYLVSFDHIKGLKPAGFEYDFLLSPKPTQRPRFSHMFKTAHDDHSEHLKTIWPEKQAYILEFPLESVFKPMDICVPVVHECFHCFGDVLRQRDLRRQSMALFIANSLATAIGCGYEDCKKFVTALTRAIYTPDDTPYLSTTIDQLRSNTYQLLAGDGLATILSQIDDVYYFYSEGIERLWDAAKQKFFRPTYKYPNAVNDVVIVDSILDACNFYFKECYADAMTIALLKLSPMEYMNQIKDEVRRFDDMELSPLNSTEMIHQEIASFAQRFAIVLVACCDLVDGFTTDECIRTIEEFKIPHDSVAPSNAHLYFAKVLRECFESLVNHNKCMPMGISKLPPAALYQVVEYLKDSIKLLYQLSAEAPLAPSVSEDFDRIIRKGNMFGKRFYDLIYEHHEDVRTKVKKAENSHQHS